MNHIKLADFKELDWKVALNTIGNAHSTLIGLIVSWWIHSDYPNREALDSGPSFGYRKRSDGGGGMCDALLLDRGDPKGIVEVEGSRFEKTINKIGYFFKAEYSELESIEFAVFLAYSIGPEGRGKERNIQPPPLQLILDSAIEVTKKHRNRSIYCLILEKEFKRITEGIRKKTEYYSGTPINVNGYHVLNGSVVEKYLSISNGI